MGSKGDLFDGMLWAASLASEPEQISSYPEHVIDTLRAFYKVFNLPEGAIPSRKKAGFDKWIIQLEDLNKLFTTKERMYMAMERAHNNYVNGTYKPPIYQPLSIKQFLINAIRELREELENTPNQETIIVASQEKREEAVRQLKKMLRK